MDRSRREVLRECLVGIFGSGQEALVEEAVERLAWMELRGGEVLIREGEPADAVFVVVSGRLRVGDGAAGHEVVRGETLGEARVLMGEDHDDEVIAVRDSIVARMGAEDFEAMWRRHPEFSIRVARGMVARAQEGQRRDEGERKRPATVCLVPISDGFDVAAFAHALADEMGRWGDVSLQWRETVEREFGPGAGNARPTEERYHRLSVWLDEIERANDFTVLVADDGETEWTRRCIRHADQVLLIARMDAPMRIHPIEERLCMGENAITAARQSLVLVHPGWMRHPSGTAKWIDRRPVDAHYHIRPELGRDVARLARILTGHANGLVFSGGGAKGFAHLGAFKAMEEAGIPIDFVGGTSIGAVMAAYVSFDRPADELIEYAREAFATNPTGDYNLLPIVSLVRGRQLKKTIHDAVVAATGAESDVLDSWRTLFCIASSFSEAREVVITRGRLERALRASVSIPVALPPIPLDGELLVDGGIFNNFPTDVMANMGVRRLIGVDLSSSSGHHDCEYEEVPGPVQLLRGMLGKSGPAVPSLGTLLVGTTLLYSESRREQAREAVDLYINPDLSGIGLLEWTAFDRTVELGYREAVRVLSESDAQG